MKKGFSNVKLVLEYDGTNFSGWELQPGKRTIRDELQNALSNLFNAKIKVFGVSRTDSKVHALSQVVNFNARLSFPIEKLAMIINTHLPYDIRVISAEKLSKNYKTRFKAKSKEYEYLIFNAQMLPAHLRNLAWHVKPKLNISAMKKAAKYLVGRHDFSSFCAAGSDDKDFKKTIYGISIKEKKLMLFGDKPTKVLSIKVTGSGFLYKMVRNIVGTLYYVGINKLKPNQIKDILKSKDRSKAGKTAPAQGLCLTKVNFL